MPYASRTIVIVGAGFSGTTVAINLLRLAAEEPLRIVLVDRARGARGVAYTQREWPYLLNVPAGRMSATSAEPTEFLTFAQRRLPGTTAASSPRTKWCWLSATRRRRGCRVWRRCGAAADTSTIRGAPP